LDSHQALKYANNPHNIKDTLQVLEQTKILKQLNNEQKELMQKEKDWIQKITLDLIQESNKIIISINDTAVGMSQDKLQSLFEFSNDKSTYGTNNEKKTELELLICIDFVELQNGSIWAESEIVKDSTFFFSIPN